MKRFYNAVATTLQGDCRQVTLDGRPLRTQAGAPQLVPTQALAELLAGEWRDQGEEIDPRSFPFRDLADYAIDRIAPDPAAAIATLLPYAETDTLCYRADPDEPLYRRQQELWEPLLARCEERHGVRFERASGVMHRRQPEATIAALRAALKREDEFTLSALNALASIAASLTIALAALEDGADAETLFAAANCEEDWQAEQWGWDEPAAKLRAARLEAFGKAMEFARAARG